jgi:cation:H+ antiporter
LIVVALGVIVAGSIGLVRSTLTLANAWGLPHDLVGVFVLAGLTGLPNAYAAARLALHGRGTEVVSEAFNSNTINLLVGIGLPALVIGLGQTGRYVPLDLAWLLGLTVLVLLLARQGGLSRWKGAGIIGLDVLFVLMRVLAPAP